ncbi:MAG: hypothetical protein OXB86_06830 [Bdellovibrionales bacterium]|nr:hypothetical protein [Bdellovibrionales bacterium]
MKSLYFSFLVVIFMAACDSDTPPAPDITRHDQSSTHPGGTGATGPGQVVLNPLPGNPNINIPNIQPPLTLEQMEWAFERSRMCDFKEDHIVSKDNHVPSLSSSFVVKGSEKPLSIEEVIKDREHENWFDQIFDWRSEFDIMNSGESKITFYEGHLFVPYEYDGSEEYGNWCPADKDKECIVWVIYEGSIQKKLMDTDNSKSIAEQPKEPPSSPLAAEDPPSTPVQVAGPASSAIIGSQAKPPSLPGVDGKPKDSPSSPGAAEFSSASIPPNANPRRVTRPQQIDLSPLANWEFTGDLKVWIQFPEEKVLYLSNCDKVDEK